MRLIDTTSQQPCRAARRGRSAITRPCSAAAVILACWISIAGTAHGQIILLEEDFEDLTLGPFVSDDDAFQNIATDEDWTDELPPGWTRDNTTTPAPTPGDFTTGPREYFGWTFLDKDQWTLQQGDQDRSFFTRGSGTVAVADGDGYDDLPPGIETGNLFNAFLMTPEFSLAGLPANSVEVSFDSSWRPYGAKRATVDVSFDSGASWNNLLTYTVFTAGPVSTLAFANEAVRVPMNNPAGGTAIVRWGLEDSGNAWWWAFDNVEIVATGDPMTLEVNKGTGAMRFLAQVPQL